MSWKYTPLSVQTQVWPFILSSLCSSHAPVSPVTNPNLTLLSLTHHCVSVGYSCCEGRVCLAYASTSLSIIKESQDRDSNRAGTWRQELMQRPWRSAAYRLASHGLLNLLSYKIQDHQPRDTITHNGVGHPPLITNWENDLHPDFMETFFPVEVPSSQIIIACVKFT